MEYINKEKEKLIVAEINSINFTEMGDGIDGININIPLIFVLGKSFRYIDGKFVKPHYVNKNSIEQNMVKLVLSKNGQVIDLKSILKIMSDSIKSTKGQNLFFYGSIVDKIDYEFGVFYGATKHGLTIYLTSGDVKQSFVYCDGIITEGKYGDQKKNREAKLFVYDVYGKHINILEQAKKYFAISMNQID